MKRLILRVIVMLLTFAFGFAIDQIISSLAVPSPPPNPTQTVLIAPPSPHVPVASKPAQTPDPILILDYDEGKIDRWGYYYILGSTPKEFADFDSIAIGLTGPMEGDIGNSRGFISVETSSGETDDVAHANVVFATERRLFFATSPAKRSGVEYWFDGAFLRNDFEAVVGQNKAVLRGTLTKVKDGKKIAQRTLSFRMEHMGC